MTVVAMSRGCAVYGCPRTPNDNIGYVRVAGVLIRFCLEHRAVRNELHLLVQDAKNIYAHVRKRIEKTKRQRLSLTTPSRKPVRTVVHEYSTGTKVYDDGLVEFAPRKPGPRRRKS